MPENRDLHLAIDVGTGSIRAALVDQRGHILAIDQREHEQIVPHHGWSATQADLDSRNDAASTQHGVDLAHAMARCLR